jgi:hypothetical protein
VSWAFNYLGAKYVVEIGVCCGPKFYFPMVAHVLCVSKY